MFHWLKSLFTQPTAAASTPPVNSDVRVSFDDARIVIAVKDGSRASLDWSELARVSISTTDAGPITTDLFWHLENAQGEGLTVPMGVEGEHELLQAMQRRLEGFDNMAVVEAMGSTEIARFLVWSSDENAETGAMQARS